MLLALVLLSRSFQESAQGSTVTFLMSQILSVLSGDWLYNAAFVFHAILWFYSPIVFFLKIMPRVCLSLVVFFAFGQTVVVLHGLYA